MSGKVYSGPFSGGAAYTQTYTYDNYGNLTGTTTNGTLVNTPASTTTNRLTGGSYDVAGNLIGWSGNSYEYDAFDQMTRLVSSGEEWRYMYTASDERFWSYRVAGGAGSVWTLRGPGGQVLREYTSNLGWGTYKDSIYRGSTLLAIAASPAAGGGVSHLHTDHLGTPRLITDAAGNPATKQYHAYYPYGQELAATYTTTYTERQRFTGHERDLVNIAGQGDDLDYMHARHYSPITGRFLSDDFILGNPRAPQTWNRYNYTWGNPLLWVDPNGLEPQAFFVTTGRHYSGFTPSILDPVAHSAIFIRDTETIPPVDAVFSNGGIPPPVSTLSDYLGSYDSNEVTRLYPLNLTAAQIEALHASLRYQFRPIGDSGVRHVASGAIG